MYCSFYIILSGQTSVYIDTLKSDNENVANAPAVMDIVDDINVETSNDMDDVISEGKKKKELDRSKYGKFIIHFGITIWSLL